MATSQENKHVEITLKLYGFDYSSPGYCGTDSYYLDHARVIKGTMRRAERLALAYIDRAFHGWERRARGKIYDAELVEIYLGNVLVKVVR